MQDILTNTECWLVSKEIVDNFTRLFKKGKPSLRKQPPLVSSWNAVYAVTAETPFRLVEENFSCGTTNQKERLDLGNDTSSVCNFCSFYSDIILWGS